MSMIAIPFAVDISKVRSVFGCKDEMLFERIKTTGMYENYASQSNNHSDPKYVYDFDQALRSILFDYIEPKDRKVKSGFLGLRKLSPSSGLDENLGYAYGYALLIICDTLGTHLLPACDGFYYGRAFEAAVGIMKERDLQLDLGDTFEHHNVFDIPQITDFPAINLFNREEIAHINEVMNKVYIDENKTDLESGDYDEVQEMLKNIKDSFQACANKNLEMITFTH